MIKLRGRIERHTHMPDVVTYDIVEVELTPEDCAKIVAEGLAHMGAKTPPMDGGQVNLTIVKPISTIDKLGCVGPDIDNDRSPLAELSQQNDRLRDRIASLETENRTLHEEVRKRNAKIQDVRNELFSTALDRTQLWNRYNEALTELAELKARKPLVVKRPTERKITGMGYGNAWRLAIEDAGGVVE